MMDFLVKGGPLMVPILLGSVIALAVFLERLWSLRRSRVVPAALGDRVRELVREGRVDAALAACEGSDAAIARVLSVGLRHAGQARELVKERVEEVGRRESAQLDRYVGVLGVIASVEPLMGLLGTVTGMITVFQRVVAEGVGDPRILASGIWEALITTAAGLTIAIPVYVAWRFLLSKVRDLVLEMEEDAVSVVDMVAESAPAGTPPRAEAGGA